MTRHLARTLVLVLSCAVPLAAQTYTELLQKAIYTQETLGDVDGAIRIYQQIINSAPVTSDVRRQAQQRLETLQAQRRKPSLPPPTAVPLGTYDGRIYRHNRTGVTFEVPEGWKVHGTGPSSDNGEMVRMSSVDPIASVSVWMIPEKNDWTSINEKLDASPAMKVTNRLEMGFFPGYRLRDGSVRRVVIGGKQAMVAIADYADYTDSSGRMAEYMTWIYTENTHTFFFARVEADKLEQLQPQLDALLSSAHIP